ncbi:tRNA wybutosine-synthesizing protein [Wickerhamomyces ciferrii]|uniref:S-adenosyl-L-methionine-dependent tRNA 4-demethylwyosine synthase n=1 Tax=Wickerhamomyces ciferrii (strain ATCC 14091 / BCRC 22168 / CBS 111 / JCM 3599 / NBRC 0793 / NRRL Y-1031 F-60-10) TaxID=1206466 RepID=K0KX33_WICCF|nr:tRNA wybutosine-synthesizing protein [Wickerhamomyces ciferrii]CCH45653.1 tRNA wybutosine-synthesizing protein [Wickerhamomyces ciferrii]
MSSKIPTSLVVSGAIITYLLSGGRFTIALFAATVYALFIRKVSQDHQQDSISSNGQNHEHKHKHKKEGGCGSACTCKDKKKENKKTLSGLKKLKGFGKKSEPQDDGIAVDFTTAFAKKPTTTTTDKSTGRPANGKPRVKRVPKLIKSKGLQSKQKEPPKQMTKANTSLLDSNIIIFYTSLTGASERSAKNLYETMSSLNLMGSLKNKPQLMNLDDITDLDDYFMNVPKLDNLIYCLVLPSYDVDSPIDYFLQTLEDTYQDFRVDKYPLKKLLGFTVLGLGDLESWPEKFCYQAKKTDYWLGKLGARRIFPVGEMCIKTQGDEKIKEWINLFVDALKDDEPILYEYRDSDAEDSDAEDGDANSSSGESEDTLVDVEDMGNMMKSSEKEKISNSSSSEVKEMVAKNSPTFKSLTKQGYTIVGSHSGVKICRWTKSALRGRGSCYKFAFYGIRSHLCMETTPSLSCSNKCVFCWRHGTNPVGTNWRWQVDQPDVILEGALQGHYSKIKQMRGVPGVVADRFTEAFRVRHCALSLVGEPIFYPYINDFVGMLHEREISSFLVCNAQHPDQLEALHKVTQLYVSIDAPTKNELKKVDRPLFKDYWERLIKCLDILRTSQAHQRTVFRLTLVKGFNMSEAEAYADLVERARPSLIEIKGATFCGSSSGNGNPLTMQNIPFYEECQNFVKNLTNELNKRGLGYGIAAEHAHSCCILVGSNQFNINGEWHTHIDYSKFFELLKNGQPFDKLDYIAKTPDWALWGSDSAGFNPEDTRVRKKGKNKEKKAPVIEEVTV